MSGCHVPLSVSLPDPLPEKSKIEELEERLAKIESVIYLESEINTVICPACNGSGEVVEGSCL